MDPLANAVWHALTTHHASLAEVAGPARRYPADVSPFAAADVLDDGAWEGLAALAGPSGRAVLFREGPIDPPRGWTAEVRGVGHQLVLERLAAGPGVEATRLGPDDVPAMLALVGVARPGPFLPRTVELGRYWGVHGDDGVLVAMAGERLHLSGWTEVSAVCTAPEARGRGLAAALTRRVVEGVLGRGERAFLHVAEGNDGARRVYERLGFTHRRDVGFAILAPPPTAPGTVTPPP